MELIKTKSFELASISQGDKNSGKLALLLPGRLDTKDYVSFVSHLKYFADRGFYAVAFDPPGARRPAQEMPWPPPPSLRDCHLKAPPPPDSRPGGQVAAA